MLKYKIKYIDPDLNWDGAVVGDRNRVTFLGDGVEIDTLDFCPTYELQEMLDEIIYWEEHNAK